MPSTMLPTEPEPNVVDHLIEERAGRLFKGPTGGVVRRWLYRILNYDEAVAFADRLGRLPGVDVLRRASEHLAFKIEVDGLDHLPQVGGFVLVSNHPTGIADGIILFDLLEGRRDDMVFFANRDALRVAPGLAEVIIPVDWLKTRRNISTSRDTFQAAARAARDERAIVTLPSGRLAYMTWRGLKERPWTTTAVSIARKYGFPIVPVHIKARNSWLYYLFALLSNELRDVTVFHELLNKRGRRIDVRVGAPIDATALADDPNAATERLQAYVEGGMTEPLPQAITRERAVPVAA